MSGAPKQARLDRRGNDQAKDERKETSSNASKKPTFKVVYCYNCGERDHLSANCPTKDQGTKCFQCGTRCVRVSQEIESK